VVVGSISVTTSTPPCNGMLVGPSDASIATSLRTAGQGTRAHTTATAKVAARHRRLVHIIGRCCFLRAHALGHSHVTSSNVPQRPRRQCRVNQWCASPTLQTLQSTARVRHHIDCHSDTWSSRGRAEVRWWSVAITCLLVSPLGDSGMPIGSTHACFLRLCEC
jgi:hypothetical protein